MTEKSILRDIDAYTETYSRSFGRESGSATAAM